MKQQVLAFGHQKPHTARSEFYYADHGFTVEDYRELILHYGNLTDREASDLTGVFPGLISARRNDLINAEPGSLVCFKRQCRITGNNVSAWGIQDVNK